MPAEAKEKCRRFLAVADQYQLGELLTERSHPASRELSHLASHNLPCAIAILKLIDTAALTVLLEHSENLTRLSRRIDETLRKGHRIYLCGCGATGRLSLALETLWRQRGDSEDRVVAFMAGGDVALIKSIENFEDFPSYGARQLEELGFKDGDLLVSTTEGGETPFVIGATKKAAELSGNPPFFLYCNPDLILAQAAERSRRVIENPAIEKISLVTGPMAVTGSTRMQASTVLMAAVGLCLFFRSDPEPRRTGWIHSLIRQWERQDLSRLEAFIAREAGYYRNHEYLLYETDSNYGISVLTDTTERAPTFSLYPFERNLEEAGKPLSWCYLFFPEAEDGAAAWRQLLHREPRTLEWPEIGGIASRERLLSYDFSRHLIERRKRDSGDAPHHVLRIESASQGISLDLEGTKWRIDTDRLGALGEHLLLKMVLNIHSTLIMGRLERYQGNIMTWVQASNNKLIDRSIRYVQLLLHRSGEERDYEEVACRLFELKPSLPPDQSLVLAVAKSFLSSG